MEIRQKPVTVMKDVFVAADGKEFETALECENYETGLSRKILLESIAHMKYAGTTGCFPLPMNYQIDECENMYREWYKIKTQEEFDKILKIFPVERYVPVTQFPTYIYVESSDEMYTRDVFMESFEESLDTIEFFLIHFGMSAEFKR